MIKTIHLTKGFSTIVDDADFEFLSQWKWHINSVGYAVRSTWDGVTVTKVLMHRQITAAPAGMEVDHRNHTKLDNRRSNLRLCTRSQNTANTRKKGKNLYRGVVEQAGRWYGRIIVDGKFKSLGAFSNQEDAALAYNFAAVEHYGDFATLNKAVA